MEQIELNTPRPVESVRQIMKYSQRLENINELTELITDDCSIESPFFDKKATQKGKAAVITELMFVQEHMKLYPVDYTCTIAPFDFEIEYRDYWKFHRLFMHFRFDAGGKIKSVKASQKTTMPFHLMCLSLTTCSSY
jgi:hypothetical protein